MTRVSRWLIMLVIGVVGSAGMTISTLASEYISARKPWVLVITVPDRDTNEERMRQLGSWLGNNNYRYESVPGPNMDNYCPEDVSVYEQSKAAGMKLLKEEWHGRIPELSTYDLQLFQMATLCGHMRAWQRVVDRNTSAVIFEDDAQVLSDELLQHTVEANEAMGADVILLDHRHCADSRPPHLSQQASGLVGYWVNAKAAKALLANFPLSMPVDWGVNTVFNEDVKAVCPASFPIVEHGGETHARGNSAAHGCQSRKGGFLQEVAPEDPHPVAAFLASFFSF